MEHAPDFQTALSKLKANEIDFKEEGKRIKIDGINARKLAIAAITCLLYTSRCV